MANSHKLRIEGVADFSSISKEAQSLSKQLKQTFGEDGLKIFDEDSLSFLKQEGERVVGRVKDQLSKLRKEAQDLDKAIKASTGDQKKQEELAKKRLDNVRKTVAAENQLRKLEKDRKAIYSGVPNNVIPFPTKTSKTSKGGSFSGLAGKTVKHGAMDVASQLPAIGEAAQVGQAATSAASAAATAGLGAGAIMALGALAAAAATAALAISRMAAGFEVFKKAIPNLLALTGMETRPITDRRTIGQAGRLGFGQLEVLETQKQMEQALGRAKSPRGDRNRLLNILTAARDTGMGPGQIVGGANQLRTVGGTEVAQKQIAMIMEKAITSGMDKTQASNFLASAVSLLTDINQNGTANTTALLGVMSDLTAKGQMSPEQIAKSLGGINQAISGSTGENNAFFQQAYARAGLGGGSILGTRMAIQQGLVGTDMGALQKQVGGSKHGQMALQAIQEMGLGDKNFSQKAAQGILGQIDAMFKTGGRAGREAATGFVGQVFGAKSAPEVAKVLTILDKIAKGTADKNDKKILQDLAKDPAENWREQVIGKLDPIALNTSRTAAALEKGQFELGKTSAQYINQLNSYLLGLDNTINKLLNSETFIAIKKGLSEVAGVIGNIVGGAFGDIMKLPQALSGIFDKMMDSPLEFGRTMGKGFADIVMTAWDAMLKGIQSVWSVILDVIKNPGKILAGVGNIAKEVGDAIQAGYTGLKDFGKGLSEGFSEGKNQYNQQGKVTYTPDQAKTLGNLGDVAKGTIGISAPGMMVRTAAEIAKYGMGESVKSSGVAAPAGSAAQTASAHNTDVSPVVDELKKTNMLLERQNRPGGAPRAGRETTRQN